ncbi:DNA-directed RNA polymerase subunit beta [Nocardia terpenica]|uniref:DNA-directed RNA polymerase subunit beta n=1 Tax=Nocardia terpenica TaxID=455432 RepID=A0A6G9Z083_9NOCA|nr:DNA-directed RNA polymerase subunit beta [Nocardia terpenica]QIS18908.1 DNA-directed RNA polymerase subunit beta [Nocardia terpenica]
MQVWPGGHIVAKANGYAAFTMPTSLGIRVKAELKTRGVAWGPIVAHLRANRWTFLVAWDPGLDTGATLDAELMRANVTLLRDGGGGEIAFPSPAPSSVHREWVVNPNSSYRPPAAAVLAAIRHCEHDERRSSW